MKWYTYLALKQLFPSKRKITFFSAMSIFGVSLGVCVLFVVNSVMDGFQERIKNTIAKTQGDIQILSHDIIYNTNEVYDTLKNFSEIEAVSPFACGVAMMKFENRPIFPMIKGIDAEKEPLVISLRDYINDGSLDNFDENGIIISNEIANRIGAQIGDMIDIYSPTMFENAEDNEMPLPHTLTIVATYETGYHNIDKNVAMVPLTVLQDMYNLENGVHGISVKLSNGLNAEEVAHKLNKFLPPNTFAKSWYELNEDFLFALKTEKTMMGFVLAFILIISAFSIANSLMTTVVRKTREIGLLSALGGTPIQCAACFSIQGLIVGIIGSSIGILAGMIVLRFRNNIIEIFVKICGVKDFMLKFYSFADLPAKYCAIDILKTVMFAIVVCVIASIIPARQATKINPAEALRNE